MIMETKKMTLPECSRVGRTGSKVTAERTLTEVTRMGGYKDKEMMLTYTLVGHPKSMDLHTIVYELMILAGHDVLDLGAAYKGEWTASELSGKAGDYIPMFLENCNEQYEGVQRIKIVAPSFTCQFHAGDTFAQIAEWEGVAGINKNKAYRFCCDGKELPKDVKVKPYTRCHQPKATNPYSAAQEAARINEKFEVIGPMSEALGSEGMKRALAVLVAAKCWEKKSRTLYDMARTAMRRKLWDDYGHCEKLKRRMAWLKSEMDSLAWSGKKQDSRYKKLKEEFDSIERRLPGLSQPVLYCEQDFEFAPEAWKQVDKEYVKVLVEHFNKLLASCPAPKWPKKYDLVQFKNQEKLPKKFNGKFQVYNVVGSLNCQCDRIEWYAELLMKHSCQTYRVSSLEPWVEPDKGKKVKREKGKKPAAKKTVSKKEKAEKKAVVKVDSYTVKDDAGKNVTFGSYVPNVGYEEPEKPMTIEDRLRAALRKQLAMAA